MPGSTENTEGTASAVPSVASGDQAPMTRREARALREAQERRAKKTPEAKTAKGTDAQAESEIPAPVPVKRDAAAAQAKKQEPTGPDGAQPEKPVPAPPVDVHQAKERAKAAFTMDESSSPLPPSTPASKPERQSDAPVDSAPASEQPSQQPEPRKSRAGRNLPAAIGVGVVLLGIVLIGLFYYEPLLMGLVVVLAGIGSWEVARATSKAKTAVPLLPLFVASLLLPVSAVWGGLEALGFAYLVSLLIALLLRLLDGLKFAAASVMHSVFIISWVPLLLSFALLILTEPNGQLLIATLLLLAVGNDTFGYIVGVLIGRHPMAPKISPKKSWEGFAGSMLGSMAVGALAMHFWLHMPWWTGVILAFFTTIAATTGDFSESMIKRELGIKDMSNLLPGHGGIMDRLDSILFVMPLGYLISHLLAWSVSAT